MSDVDPVIALTHGFSDTVVASAIGAALDGFRYARAARAPANADVRRYIAAEDAFIEDARDGTTRSS